MANTHETLSSLFTDIADSIREKSSGTESIVADNFPTAIRNIDTQLGTTIGDVIASSKLTQINDDWIKADGTVDVIKDRHPTLYSQIGTNEHRFVSTVRWLHSNANYLMSAGVTGNNEFLFVGKHNAYTYGRKAAFIRYPLGSFSDSLVYSGYFPNFAMNGASDVIYKNGYYIASILREPTNTTVTSGPCIMLAQFNASGNLSLPSVGTASNRSMHSIAATDSGYVMAVGVKADGTTTVHINNAANTITGSGAYSTYNVRSMSNPNGTSEVMHVTEYGSQFLVISEKARNLFVVTPNANASPTVNTTKAFSSYFTSLSGIETVNGYAVMFGVYNGKAKIAYTNGSATGTWTYKEIGAFTPVQVGYADGRYFMLGYSGETKYYASCESIGGTWTITEIGNPDASPYVTDMTPVALLTDGNGEYVLGGNQSSGAYVVNELSPVIKQPAITVSGRTNVFVKRTEGGVG